MKNLKSYEEFSIGGGWGKEAEAQGLEKVAIIRGTDFEKIISSNFSTVPIRYETTRKISSRQLCEGDLIIEVSGGSASSKQRTGRCLYVTQEIITKLGGKVIPASFCKLLRLKKDEINPKFIYYQINNMHLTDEISLFEVQSTGICNFQFNLFLDEVFPALTDLKKQNKVVNILENLDKKITLNTQTNQTLEQIAQAIFKHWFIDFAPVHAKANALARGETIEQAELAAMACLSGKTAEKITALKTEDPTAYHQLQQTAAAFPSEFVETEMGQVPKGWEVKKIDEVIQKIPVGKKYSQKTTVPDGKIPVLDQGKSGIIGFHNDTAGVKANIQDPVIVFANHTCYMRLIHFDFSTIQNVFAFKGKNINIYWIYLATLGKQKFVEYKGHFPDFLIKQIVVPPKELTEIFGNIVKDSFSKIALNLNTNEKLAKTRDLLLPKLLSGEIEL
ncbi:restriction endonuclease subunit S [Gallibacterium anatis]|uniref:restriction endonuclease subunit S n=1 Tax=Gallibacterium anatis TaxID=750 RepID=UPI000B010A51|nr:restriction endonuclease subunit S [Gallibacterium anatis]